ncbi:MAG TPA: hypothetical protein VJ736_11985 [Actinomycetota bacterium]|jgi:formaldehyde-activating enzyme involved in methanogenesis|nr:hypothetical protein [Actinomycetota bacterium]
MTWSVERVGSALHVSIAMPMQGTWDGLLEEIQANLKPKPLAIHIPSKVPGASKEDEEMLRVVWDSLAAVGIPLLPPV